ncbi:MAG TPA: peptidase M15 [Halieaceae bacterium]|nr:peptidase M15 [Halieaceae bacterium]
MRLTPVLLLFISELIQARPFELENAATAIQGLLTDIRYAGNDNFLGRPVDGYQAPACLLSRDSLQALTQAQEHAQKIGLTLLVYDCYRPQRAVDDFIRWIQSDVPQTTKERYYPNVKKEDLIAQGYIASQSGHSRGSAIDLTLADARTGEPIDMGTSWDFFDPSSHTDSVAVSNDARQNRRALKGMMEAAGFRAYYAEWWHFTLIDEPNPNTYFNRVIK